MGAASSTVTTAERVAEILAGLTLADKVGLLFHTVMEVGPGGTLAEPGTSRLGLSTHELVAVRGIRHFNVVAIGDPAEFARWQNDLQRLALSTGSRLPVVLTANPCHSVTHNEGSSLAVGAFSQWPEPLGFGAIGDVDTVRRFAEVVRSDYRRLGIRGSLSPNLDLATEPRWARLRETWGADAATVDSFGATFISTLQGTAVGPDSVFCMAKHFPGGGAQKDGEDPHFAIGREQVYPGGTFDTHLEPFRGAIGRGVAAIMPGYGIPVGVVRGGEPVEEVAFGFNKQIIGGMLRDELGFTGVVCTDWGIVSDMTLFGQNFPAKAWGLEDADPLTRLEAIFAAGCDQVGGETCTDLLLELVETGRVTEQRLDESAARILTVMVDLGLVDTAFVDEDTMHETIGGPADRAAGDDAQRRSITLLAHGDSARRSRTTVPPAPLHLPAVTLPLPAGVRIFAPGLSATTVGRYGTPVDSVAEADVAIIRIVAPWDARSGLFLEDRYHSGSLEFSEQALADLRAIAAEVPLVLDVYLERAAVLTPLLDIASVLVASFGSSSSALLAVLFGDTLPAGRLPLALPNSMAAAERGFPDTGPGEAGTLFPVGFSASV